MTGQDAGEVPQVDDETAHVDTAVVDTGLMDTAAVDTAHGDVDSSAPTLLLIDDDEAFAELMQAYFTSRGCEVVTAGSGVDARAILEERAFDLIIVDGLLPDVVGMDFIGELREGPAEDTEIVFLSAFWRDSDTFRRLTTDLGVRRVLHKPIVPSELYREVETLLLAPGTANLPGMSPELSGPHPLPFDPGSLEDVLNLHRDALESLRQMAGSEVLDARPEPTQPHVDEKLAALRALYREKLDDRLTELTDALDAAQAGGPNAGEALESAHRTAHKLHGTAGSFGLEAISFAALAIELELVELLGRDEIPEAEEQERWARVQAARAP